jgi:Icc protein
VTATFQSAIDKINALPKQPAFLIHTGDISHLSKPGEFDTVDQILKGAKTSQVFYVPGEHDVLEDDGKQYLERYGKGTKGAGWHSFNHNGVHFIGLVNVLNLKAGGLGNLGQEQLEWLEKDVKGLSSSTPIVVFAHIPLWAVYPKWGWGTDDSEQALSYLKRFGSVTVLNGHIHQVMQKVEGNVTFHTAMSTAFPQPQPGTAPSPGPMKVPAEKLRSFLGLTSVNYVQGKHSLAIVDSSLEA